MGPEVVRSYQPHNDMTVAQDFLAKNGVKSMQAVLPHLLHERQEGEFDLVVSFAAYGMHIAPGIYIEQLKRVTHPDTVLIFDVRRRQKQWLKQFEEAFGEAREIHSAEKWARMAFRMRG